MSQRVIRPQKGPQTSFLSTPADIAIYGGAAGGGKSWALLLEALRHHDRPGFGATIFRRTYAQVKQEGGLWDKSGELYPFLGAKPNLSDLFWRFPSGVRIGFAHLQHESDKFTYQGAEIPLIGFDELTHFTEGQFFYLLSRNRSACGIRPYVRAATNPDSESWVARFISWWIDQETGYPIPERAGVLRWFIRDGDDLVWADTPEELRDRFPDRPPKSVTFIPARLEDNPALMAADPGYRANLLAMTTVDRERLLNGNWKIRPAAGLFFKRFWFEIIDAVPVGVTSWVRYWDRAATQPKPGKDPDWTVGTLMGKTPNGRIVVAHVERFQGSPLEVECAILRTTEQDAARLGDDYHVGIEQDPGQAGKFEGNYYTRLLAGYDVRLYPAKQDKQTRAKPFSAQAEAGNVQLVHGAWNESWLVEHENFPEGTHDDQVDSSSGAFSSLIGRPYIPPVAESEPVDLRAAIAPPARPTGGFNPFTMQ